MLDQSSSATSAAAGAAAAVGGGGRMGGGSGSERPVTIRTSPRTATTGRTRIIRTKVNGRLTSRWTAERGGGSAAKPPPA